MHIRQFEENVLVYGADLAQWPEQLRAQAERVCAEPAYAAALAEAEAFEQRLRAERVEAPSPMLAQRITAAARRIPQEQPFDLMRWLWGLFAEIRLPQPAYAMALVLMLGLGLGLSNATTNGDDAADSYSASYFFDEDGAIL